MKPKEKDKRQQHLSDTSVLSLPGPSVLTPASPLLLEFLCLWDFREEDKKISVCFWSKVDLFPISLKEAKPEDSLVSSALQENPGSTWAPLAKCFSYRLDGSRDGNTCRVTDPEPNHPRKRHWSKVCAGTAQHITVRFFLPAIYTGVVMNLHMNRAHSFKVSQENLCCVTQGRKV